MRRRRRAGRRPARSSAEGRSRATAGGASVPAGLLSRLTGGERRRPRPGRPAAAAAGKPAARLPGRVRRVGALGRGATVTGATYQRCDRIRRSSRGRHAARARAQEADLLRLGLGEIAAARARPRRGRRPPLDEVRRSAMRTRSAPGGRQAGRRWPATSPRSGRRRARPGRARAEGAGRRAGQRPGARRRWLNPRERLLRARRRRGRHRVVRARCRHRPAAAGGGVRAPGGARALTRKYGDTRRRGAGLGRAGDASGSASSTRQRGSAELAPSGPTSQTSCSRLGAPS